MLLFNTSIFESTAITSITVLTAPIASAYKYLSTFNLPVGTCSYCVDRIQFVVMTFWFYSLLYISLFFFSSVPRSLREAREHDELLNTHVR